MKKLTRVETLRLAFGVMARFRCKKIAQKPDAHSWSVEQDFLAGAAMAFQMCGREFPDVVKEFQAKKRSITTLTARQIPLPVV